MGSTSVKQQLIAALERERKETRIPGRRQLLDVQIRELRNRGSGPLPVWYRNMAAERGIR